MNSTDQKNPAFVGSLGIVRRFVDEEEQWLTIWDAKDSAYRLVQSTREESETFRDCLHKQLAFDLGLNPKKDYVISGLSMAHHQAPIEWPDECVPQWVIVQFFPVQLYGQAARNKVEQRSDVCWFTLPEIAEGRNSDGKPFHPKQLLLIERADLIPPHLKS